MSKTAAAAPRQLTPAARVAIERAIDKHRKADAALHRAQQEATRAEEALRAALEECRETPFAELPAYVQHWRQVLIGLTPEEVAAIEQEAAASRDARVELRRLQQKVEHSCADFSCPLCDAR